MVALLIGLAGCGGESAPPPSEGLGTLAYALTTCRDTPEGFFERQELHIRRGDRDTVVFQTPEVGPVTGIGRLCLALTRQRAGINSVAREAIQEIAVSPDGSTVAFEINTDFSMLPTLPLQLPADQQGIFVVSTDGSPPRRLAPPSSQRSFAVFSASFVFQGSLIQFSPDSRRLAVVDNGPDGNGHDASQLWIIDVATGARAQITHLPPPTEPTNLPPGSPTIGFLFQDNRTIGFSTAGNSCRAP